MVRFKRKCKTCSKDFQTNHPRKQYCDIICQGNRNSRRKPKKKKICTECKKDFLSSKDRQKYCSKSCYSEAHKKYSKEYNKKIITYKRKTIDCVCCGKRSGDIYCAFDSVCNKCYGIYATLSKMWIK